ncbi:SHOCT domain-containing protein [Vibrio fluminensis]|uniref:SHOCT domain-containing protein n=1 Tax=Vibrio fluminensis TaxID=2783614 RepID=UPI00188987B9|nr:SHOCT domain-containing protein [Vibrio fluminensis]
MQNQPMSSNDQSKLLIFALLFAPSIVFMVGIIPAIFLAFGIYMMKRNQDFSSIETAVKNFKGYTYLVLIIFVLSSIYWGYMYFNEENSWYSYDVQLFASLIFTCIAFTYLVAIHFLFYSPMKRHREWIVSNGIFSTKAKASASSRVLSEVDIIKGEKLKQYSVADELTKWAKLKEDGYISEEEFNEARAKLLKRN